MLCPYVMAMIVQVFQLLFNEIKFKNQWLLGDLINKVTGGQA